MGFGMALLAAPIIVLLNPAWVPMVLTTTALFLSVANTWHQKRYLNLRSLAPAFVTRIPGTLFGAWCLLNLNVHHLQLLVAAAVLVAVAVSTLKLEFQSTPTRMAWAGCISGFMGTTTSIGGPPMALIMQYEAPTNVRANLSAYFTYSCLLSMAVYISAGLFTRDIMWACVSFLPCAFFGFVLGVKVRPYVDGGRFRPLLLAMCTLAALVAAIIAVASTVF
jgi:uncharacterized membrane protein YfcA